MQRFRYSASRRRLAQARCTDRLDSLVPQARLLTAPTRCARIEHEPRLRKRRRPTKVDPRQIATTVTGKGTSSLSETKSPSDPPATFHHNDRAFWCRDSNRGYRRTHPPGRLQRWRHPPPSQLSQNHLRLRFGRTARSQSSTASASSAHHLKPMTQRPFGFAPARFPRPKLAAE